MFQPIIPGGSHQWIFFSSRERQLVVPKASDNLLLSSRETAELREKLNRSFVIGEEKGILVCCGELPEDTVLPDYLEWMDFRDIYRALGRSLQFPVSRGKQLLTWDRTHKFCGVCGKETEVNTHESSRVCPFCGEIFYPRLSPAIIVRITRGNQIMMAHNKNFQEGIFSHIAGFVEAGENLEQAVEREIMEEVGLKVENIRFFGSQPWPMPHSLMMGFTAECPEGDPVPDGVEIIEAHWFTKENLPLPPSSGSIAMEMLNDFLETV